MFGGGTVSKENVCGSIPKRQGETHCHSQLTNLLFPNTVVVHALKMKKTASVPQKGYTITSNDKSQKKVSLQGLAEIMRRQHGALVQLSNE